MHFTVYEKHSWGLLADCHFSLAATATPCDVWLGEKIVDVIVEEMTSSDSFIFHFVRREYLHLVREAVCNGKYRHKISREAAYQRLLILYSLHLWYLDRI